MNRFKYVLVVLSLFFFSAFAATAGRPVMNEHQLQKKILTSRVVKQFEMLARESGVQEYGSCTCSKCVSGCSKDACRCGASRCGTSCSPNACRCSGGKCVSGCSKDACRCGSSRCGTSCSPKACRCSGGKCVSGCSKDACRCGSSRCGTSCSPNACRCNNMNCERDGRECPCSKAVKIQSMIKKNAIKEAYLQLEPMLKQVVTNWDQYRKCMSGAGPASVCKGEAGALYKAVRMLEDWAGTYNMEPLDKMKGSMVLFTFGQSNSANYGQGHYKSQNEVYDYYEGKLFHAEDPLFGSGGEGATVWTRLGDKIIDAGMAERVTIVPIGVGGVRVGAWAKGGELYERLVNTVESLNKNGVELTYILWHQGETDNILNTTKEDYVKMFETIREVFRSRGIEAPIVVARASYHPACLDENHGNSTEVRDAQKELADKYEDIYPGPDTDLLDRTWQRGDGVHFSVLGQDLHAEMWLKSLKKVKIK